MTAPLGRCRRMPSTEIMQAVAVEVGACVRPVMQRLTDTTTGETRVVPIPCGATLAGVVPAVRGTQPQAARAAMPRRLAPGRGPDPPRG